MQKLFIILLSIVFFFIACNKISNNTIAPDVASGYTVINNGNAAVSKIDTTDKIALSIDQAIPAVSNQSYFANTPIIFFLNDKVLLSSIYDNIVVMQDQVKVKGTIYVNESYNGNAIITFTPTDAFATGSTISIVLKKDIQGQGGNKLLGDYVISYKTLAPSLISFDENKDFERGMSGVAFSGDGGLISGKFGSEKPFQKSRYVAISTGSAIISTNTAIGNISSMMYLGPISSDISSFSFEYDFISCEFNEYVGKRTDDAAIVTIYGPKGSYTERITSVNQVGVAGNTADTIPKLPDGGDNYVGHTGWLRKSISFKNVGTPAFIIFTVTNVADKQLTSILAIDSLAY
jgi:hypothetical protein